MPALMGTEQTISPLERLQALLGNCPLAVIEWDYRHRVSSWTGNAPQMFGWTASEVVGKRVDEWRFVYEEDWGTVRESMAAMESGRTFISRNRNYCKDGTIVHCEWHNSGLADPAGAFVAGLSLGVDVSERGQLEVALRVSEERHRQIFDQAPLGIFRSTVAGRFLTVNAKLATMFAYRSPDEMVAAIDDIAEQLFVDPAQRLEVLRQAFACKGFVSGVVNYRRNDGTAFLACLYLRAVRDEGGRTLCLEGFVEDITQRKETERALHESERKYRELVEHANSIILRWTHDGRITFLNEFGVRFFGYSAEEIIGRHVMGTIVPTIDSGGRDLRELIDQISADPLAFEQNVNENMRRNGERVWIAWTNRIVRDAQGRVAEILSVGTDITEQKRAEEAIRELNASLERRVAARTAELAVARDHAEAADRLKSAFLATMSHELRTPLNSIIGFTGIILQGLAGPLNAEQRKQLEMVRGSARHLLALINDVLDISKIEAGQLEVSSEPFDLPAAIVKVAGIVKPLVEKKNLALRVELAPEIGTLVSDPRRVEQVLLNLLNNAIKFTERGVVTLTAEIVQGALRNAHSAIRISVADTGIGIKGEDLDKLFQPFRQIDSGLSRQHEGTGLGLAICRRLAELLGGEIQATSDWGKGSVFTLTLPMKGPGK